MLLQIRFDELVQAAVHDLLDIPHLNVRPVVLHHLIRLEHIGTDLAPKADFFFLPDEGFHCGLLLFRFQFVEARLEHLHGAGLVLELRALILTLDHNAGRDVRDADGGFHLIHVLAAGAAGPEGVDLEVVVIDHDVHVLLDLGVHEDRCERSVPAFVRVKRGDADQPVHAGLGLEITVAVRARDRQGGALDSGLVAWLEVQRLDRVPLPLRPPDVHPQQHLGPVL